MPITYVASTTGSATGTTNGTLTMTLSTAPSSGTWVFVSVMSGDPVNMNPGTIRCGTIILNAIDLGDEGSGNLGPRPALYGAPFQTGMTTSVTVPWINSLGPSRQIVAATALLSGMAATPTTAYAHLRSINSAGLFDGTCGPITSDIGTTVSVSGVTNGILTYTSSSGIRTAYDSQSEPYIGTVWQNGTVPSPVLVSATLTTVITGVITTTGQSSGVVTLSVSNAGFPSSGNAYLCTASGVCLFSYSSKPTTTSFSGCVVPSGSDFYSYGGNLAGQGILGGTPCLIPTSTISPQPYGGWLAGSANSPASAQGAYVTTTGITGGLPAGILHLFWGNSLGKSITPAYLVTATGSTSVGSSLFTLVPSTRKMSRGSNVIDSDIIAVRKNVRKTIAIITKNALVIRKNVKKIVNTVINNIAFTKKQVVKTAKATYNNIASVVKSYVGLRSTNVRLIQSVSFSKKKLSNRKSTVQLINGFSLIKRYSASRKSNVVTNESFVAIKIVAKGKKAIVRFAQSISAPRVRAMNRRSSATVGNRAVVTRVRNYPRIGRVTISYTISNKRRKTSIRIAIATVNAIIKNISTRPFYIFHTNDQVSQANQYRSSNYTVANDTDLIGDYSAQNDQVAGNQAVEQMSTPVGISETPMSTPADYAEPDNPSGEDVVPT